MGYWLGIDLGTTRTAAAVLRGNDVQTSQLGTRTADIPSAIYLAADGTFLVGEAAQRRGAADPGRLATEFKRRIGDPVPLYIAGSPYPAHVLTARLLAEVVRIVTDQQGGSPDGVTVTRPANWGPYKTELHDQMLRLAGLPGGHALPEPVAAAAEFASEERVAEGECVAVYDLGGGTYDVAVLRRTAASFTLLGRPDGIEQLGGVDFDDAVFRFALNAAGGVGDLDPLDPAVTGALARLRRECGDAKEALSYDTEVVIPVALPGLHTQILLHRSELEDMIRPALTETVACLRRALRAAQVQPDELRCVLLTGGSSRIPLVRELVADAVRRPVILDSAPEHSIARGAARDPAGLRFSAESHSRADEHPGASRGDAPAGRTPQANVTDPAAVERGASGRRRLTWIAAVVAVAAVAATVFVVRELSGGDGSVSGTGQVGGTVLSSAEATDAVSTTSPVTAVSSPAAPSSASSVPSSPGSTGNTVGAIPQAAAPLPAMSLLVARSVNGEDGLFAVDGSNGQLGPRMPTTGVERPLISPDRRSMIYIQTYAADESQLWIAGVDGRGERPVFAERPAGCDRYLVAGWNPVESDQLVLPCLSKDDRFALRIVRLDGTVVQEFDLAGRFVDGASFAPDGRSVAFNSPAPGETAQSIYTAASDGSSPPVQLTSGGNDVAPSWSPDGRQIVFFREPVAGPGGGTVQIVGADGSGQRELGASAGADDVNPAWSTDGASIVFRSNRDQSNPESYRFWVMDADGGNVRQLLPGDQGSALSTPGWARR